ncbi:MAG: ribosome small subunit-dependent GTPase A [Dehalococcoidales bacterium]|nr:ribosome small subunit-dependent GTPase A [Dehalococcoidales bacterium]
MREGIIVRAYAGFYYVKVDPEIWECKVRGRLRLNREKILPGDRVEVSETAPGKGVIERILPRTRELLRPAVANVQQVVVVMSLTQPEPNLGLLDRLLVLIEAEKMDPLIVFNKVDLVTEEVKRDLVELYRQAGYPVVATSACTGTGINELQGYLQGQISILAGPSGVGKSSLLNAVQPGLALRTGMVSQKIGRGRHTTRYVELLPLEAGGLVADSPGFSVLTLPRMKREELSSYFREMDELTGGCRFNSCLHRSEPDCVVKQARQEGRIDERRYQSYITLLQEVIANEQRY